MDRRAVEQFLRFGAVGTAGFVVDATAVTLLARLGLDLYLAGILGWFVAASFTWALNRHFTFDDADRTSPVRQWLRFLASQTLGFVLNRGTYALLVAFWPAASTWPVLAVAAGACAGLFANFIAARRFAFRPTR